MVAGCAGQATPAWTYVPISQPTPGPTGAPSVPLAGAAATPESSVGGVVLDVTAKGIAFDQKQLTAPANVPLTVHFDNEDAGVPHDVAIYRGSATGDQLFQGKTITGAATIDYAVSPLPAGTYTVVCIVHPTQMIATLTVGTQ